jgi:competence protein ComEA
VKPFSFPEAARPRGLRAVVRSLLEWRWAAPLGRVALVALGLGVLALIGRSAVAGAVSPSPPPVAQQPAGPPPAIPLVPVDALSPASAPPTDPPPATPQPAARSPASADDPVILNDATADDLRRLPGIGPKKADAILQLRRKMGRFSQVEDLLKVKGIGRGTLKRIRPLVRLDAPDAGVAPRSPA